MGGWIWAVLDEMYAPGRLVGTLRALYVGPTALASCVCRDVVTDSVFDIARGIQQGCPSSGSSWALVFDPKVCLLRARMPGPRGEPSVFADDIVATLVQVIA